MPAHTATAQFPHLYIECDVPEGQTLSEWRRARTEADRPAPSRLRRRRLLRRLV
jgi:hypothetical protein